MTLESTIETYFCKRVVSAGGIAVKTTVPGVRGFFDRTVFWPGGKVWLVELKRPRGGRLAQHQKDWRDRLRAMGFEVKVLKNKEEVDECFS